MERFDDAMCELAECAVDTPGVVSAAMFMQPGSGAGLELVGAAGIEGEPLRQLAEAVRKPAHPIARTFADASASFDVKPTAPGGPALRSHLPIFRQLDGRQVCVGVLAVAHESALDEPARQALRDVAVRAGRLLATGAV
jgi:hypothetical protein